MHIDVFSAFRETADRNGILFYYSGSLSQNVIGTMGDALKKRLDSQDANGTTSRKLFSSFVEMLQNAIQYSPDDPDSKGDKVGSVAVGKSDDKYFIMCGNLIKKQHVERIREKLEPLKNMSLDEIKQAYRAQLKNDHHSEDPISKGAGLGFLTLARDSTEPIEYALIDAAGHENELSCFYLKAMI
ncbi:SiaB family protein kinase [Sulfuriferula thiophila]|uniref:SiaB family protein kinase n=1 Tax=Sulfuriferula thiophila TaxID=1781211 RepID=UPI000F60F258|nr:SiaB family protein kinase [Sulfuriferula thiophila]